MRNISRGSNDHWNRQVPTPSTSKTASGVLNYMQENWRFEGEELQRMENEGGTPLSIEENAKVFSYFNASKRIKKELNAEGAAADTSIKPATFDYSALLSENSNDNFPDAISCDWDGLCAQLMLQWINLTLEDLSKAGPHRHQIALLIAQKYGVASEMVENYLCNFERTMPLAS